MNSFFSIIILRFFLYLIPINLLLIASNPQYSLALGVTPKSYPVAMQSYGIWNPIENERIDIAVWYPAKSNGRPKNFEGWDISVASSVSAQPGFYPIILVSHDTSSSRFANSDLSISLASKGFIVVAPNHMGDNLYNSRKIYTGDLFYQRPRQLLLSLEKILSVPELAPYADESRIGVLGIGFGSMTTMQLIGEEPDFLLLKKFCAKSKTKDPFCSSWSGHKMALIKDSIPYLKKTYGDNLFTPPIDLYSPELEKIPILSSPIAIEENKKKHSFFSIITELFASKPTEKKSKMTLSNASSSTSENATVPEFIYMLDFQGGELFGGTNTGEKFVEFDSFDSPLFRINIEGSLEESSPEPEVAKVTNSDLRTHRRLSSLRSIKAVAFMNPAGGMLFAKNSTQIILPSAIIYAGKNILYNVMTHGKPYESLFATKPKVLEFKEADHYSTFTPCSSELSSNLQELCGKISGVDRKKISETRDDFFSSFFLTSLGSPLPQPEPTGFIAVKKKKTIVQVEKMTQNATIEDKSKKIIKKR